MPRLVLLRHAKSSDRDRDLEDFDRPLSRRGRGDADLVGGRLIAAGITPDRILCSAARRCRETLHRLLPTLDEDLDVRITRDLYAADEDRTVDKIRALGGAARTLMVIGHEPGLSDTARGLAGSSRPRLFEDLDQKFPTAALAVIDFPAVKWVDIEPKTGRLVAFLKPRFGLDGAEPLDVAVV
jgi:phosphohistidine phosphatase